ncbi:MAG: deoxyribodipyrimidine photo-lyase, partial [Acetobacteraceae bacterium]|nr:deoxyribodipyrimidine photo-lyase [Acetobacteraceae bacterium]
IVWFRSDLRLSDNEALLAAAADGRPVLPVYILDDATAGPWALGGAARWWLGGSLRSLADSLHRLGAPLMLCRGDPAAILPALLDETGAAGLHAGLAHEPAGRQVEAALAASLGDRLHLHRTHTLFDLDAIRTGGGTPYGVYTPFARACRARANVGEPLPPPAKLTGFPPPRSDRLESWNLFPTKPDWAAGFRDTWQVGEPAAQDRLQQFLVAALSRYATGRNLPGEDGTSRLSAHLRWGEISARQVWYGARLLPPGDGQDTYTGEILWREFCAYLLWHHPTMPDAPLRPAFGKLPFRHAPAELAAWQRGRTGIPIVDAGMRQLWQTGWMHNRVRMVAASFLVKQLLIDWREGERWFWDTLIDADLASNAAGWQWIAGCGIDSQPFFRVFNPVSQGETWDKAGAYVRRFVPELAALPDKFLHAPWTAPPAMLAEANITLGRTYPNPVADLRETRQRALDAYRTTVRGVAA